LQIRKTKNNSDILLQNEEDRKDLGFGTRLTDVSMRLLNPNGTINVKRTNVPFWERINLFHRLTVMSWPRFLLAVFCLFFLTNCLFSGFYILIGTEHLLGIIGTSMSERFWESFFFSAQTLTTVGYGRISPVGHLASAVAAIEALMGLLSFALATGLLYGRFSRPIPKILFSRNILVSPYLEIEGLMFRIINERSSELIDLKVDVTLSRIETLPNGTKTRKYYTLKLERSQVNLFPISWTIVHPIIEESPLYEQTPELLAESDAEFLIFIRAIDETFSQAVHLRYSYRFNEMVWDAKFRPMFDSGQALGKPLEIDVQNIHLFDLVGTELISDK
jgi:inward rectifier potassium channel